MVMEMMIDAELRLGPPGCDVTVVQPARKKPASAAKRPSSVVRSEASGTDDHDDASPASKVQVVGWPPVRAYRKNAFHAAAEAASARTTAKKGEQGGGLYVKVSMDGAPYLRKVDLRTYDGYRELRDALDVLFGCFSSSSADGGGGGCQFAIAYEDKDGDLMLAGDVPWDMFICSCKKLRIMRGSEAR
ncbi:hypothetical protein U9M48_010840 [Paspalum notatum var. saurae]|uniref:Auxin-responsive protein n=1 Tax=Paspalum notatum var. saurae TaxID=547442 RepID=A0AAQ3SVW4_PASNO